MKTLVIAAVAALSLSAASADAAGGVAGGNSVPNVYGSQAFVDHSNEPQAQFLGKNTVFGRLFGHGEQTTVANKTPSQQGS
jgi:hypothetical protein